MNPKSLVPWWQGRSGAMTDPFRAMQEDMDRVLSRLGGSSSGESLGFLNGDGIAAPTLDIAEEDGAFEVTMDVPGVEAKDIDIEVENGVLTVSGQREAKTEEGEKGKSFHRVERYHGRFVRRIALPTGIDDSAAEARHENGVLTIRLPKLPEAQARQRRIEVKSAQA